MLIVIRTLSNNKVKKLLLKIEYISLDLEDTTADFRSYEAILNNDLCKEIEYLTFLNKKEEKITPHEVVVTEYPKSKLVRKIYKNLSKILHPDVNRGLNSTEEFKEVVKYYEKSNLIGLIKIANTNNIDFGELSNDDIEEIERSLSTSSDKVSNLKKTLAWFWGSDNGDIHAKKKKAREILGINEDEFEKWKMEVGGLEPPS